MKAIVAIAKVKWVVALAIDTGEGREVRPFTAYEGVPAPSNICLLGVDRYLRFLDDSIPSKV